MGTIDKFERTYEFGGLVRAIEVDVSFRRETACSSEIRTVSALVDTGAELSGIKSYLAEDFGFKIVRETYINTATDSNVPARIFSGDVWLDGYVMYVPEIAEITNKDNPHDFVIGMNILRHCDFAVSNADGKTVFTLRFPPREHIRFDR